MTRHLDEAGAPIQLLLFVFEKIGTGAGISLDIVPANIACDRRVALAELPADMLGVDAPAIATYQQPHTQRSCTLPGALCDTLFPRTAMTTKPVAD